MSNITMEEVEKHNTINDCWIVSHGKVYDVSSFINKHPGGKFVIKSHAGTEVSKHYNYHSKNAHKIWEKYLIGEIITKSGRWWCC
jgi:cytochrome b involved in lipid metabolism|tara:strand:+ start:873 stop:1127 length:255 start_codon:yes stop_codon:yes gene_type:complete